MLSKLSKTRTKGCPLTTTALKELFELHIPLAACAPKLLFALPRISLSGYTSSWEVLKRYSGLLSDLLEKSLGRTPHRSDIVHALQGWLHDHEREWCFTDIERSVLNLRIMIASLANVRRGEGHMPRRWQCLQVLVDKVHIDAVCSSPSPYGCLDVDDTSDRRHSLGSHHVRDDVVQALVAQMMAEQNDDSVLVLDPVLVLDDAESDAEPFAELEAALFPCINPSHAPTVSIKLEQSVVIQEESTLATLASRVGTLTEAEMDALGEPIAPAPSAAEYAQISKRARGDGKKRRLTKKSKVGDVATVQVSTEHVSETRVAIVLVSTENIATVQVST